MRFAIAVGLLACVAAVGWVATAILAAALGLLVAIVVGGLTWWSRTADTWGRPRL